MKALFTLVLILMFSPMGFSKDLVVSKSKHSRKPSSGSVKVNGEKAEALFRAILASDETLIDNCTAHTCTFTTKCDYNQSAEEKDSKYSCMVTH